MVNTTDTPKTSRGPFTGDWYDERNARRKERYHSDPDYRKTANDAARHGYRKTRGDNKPFDPRQNLPKLSGMGTKRVVRLFGEGVNNSAPVITFTKAELAAVFSRPSKQLQQWSADGRIPPPRVTAKVPGVERNWLDVYTLAEARAIVIALGEHLSDLIYFRRDHVSTILAVHKAVEKVRG